MPFIGTLIAGDGGEPETSGLNTDGFNTDSSLSLGDDFRKSGGASATATGHTSDSILRTHQNTFSTMLSPRSLL